jgi:hypothetical protein
MLDLIYSLSFIKFSFNLAKMFTKTLISYFINKPNIFAIFNLIYQFSNWIKSWIIFIIKSTYSLIVLFLASIAVLFYFNRKQNVSSFNFNFCRTVYWKLSFSFGKLLYGNLLSQHFLAVAIFLNIIYFCKPN